MSHSSLRLLRSPRYPLRNVLLSQSPPIAPRISVRSASTSSTAGDAGLLVRRLKSVLYGTSISFFAVFTYLYVTDTRAGVHQWLVVPALRWVYPDAEDAHHAGTKALKALYSFGIHPRDRNSKARDEKGVDLGITVFGQTLQNPIGTSAGIDKLAEIPDALLALGPAIVEVGGTTPYPQDGNPRPRVFRLPSQRALINRYGLNSLGADDMAMRLRERVRLFAYHHGYGIGSEGEQLVLNGGAGVPPGSLVEGKMLAVQVAKNKVTKDEDIEAVRRDYVYCVERLAPYADILVVNVSSPNTPGLRTLQRVEPLTRILEGVVGAARKVDRKTSPRVMVKVSPDEDQDEQIEGIVEAIWKSGVDGVIVGNTTNRRDHIPKDVSLPAKERQAFGEQGGFSGPHMFNRTLALVKRYRRLLDQGPPLQGDHQEPVDERKVAGDVTTGDESASSLLARVESTKAPSIASKGTPYEPKVIFATGGITNGKQALEVLNAGASVAQIYTALIYGGVGTVSRIKKEIKEEILNK